MSEDHQYFYRQDIYDILTGAALLASGGGGSIDSARELAETILDYSCRVEYVDPMQTKDHAMAVVVAGMGSPLDQKKDKGVIKEGPKWAFEEMEKETGQQIFYTVPIETGALNQLVPMLVSAQKGIPIIDGDGGGRSFPELSMATFSKIKEALNWPFVISTEASFEEGGTKAIVYQKDVGAQEDTLRSITISSKFGGTAFLACYLMECRYMRSQSIVRNTLTRARDVGRSIRKSLDQGKNPSEVVISELSGYKLAMGTITEIKEYEKGGFDWTTVNIECEGDRKNVKVMGDNENLLAISDDGRPLAMGPDLICYMGEQGPLTNADIQKNQKITLIGLRADPSVRATSIVAAYMKVCSKLGYKGPYIPIEDLAREPLLGGRI